MLEYRLQKTFPEKQIEVINLSITAISSYTLLSFTDEVLGMQPDAILIYTGHNEYYGAMGVGSGHRIGLNRNLIRAVIWLRQSKVVQLALNSYASISSQFAKKNTGEEPGMMSKMAGEQQILLGSTLYQAGLKQFSANMDELLRAYHDHGVPVYLSNLVANEKGQKPFISRLKTTTDSLSFQSLHRQSELALSNGDTALALTAALGAWKKDSTYAGNNFLIADIYYARQQFNDAAEYYRRSKETDALRFRAPEGINRIITELSHRYNNIHFVDTKRAFDSASHHGIHDNDLFTDHLHPNIDGYFLIADAFYRSMQTNTAIGDWSKANNATEIRGELPVSAVDSIYGSLVVMFMKEEWPFFEKPYYDKRLEKSYPEHLAINIFLKQMNWEMAMDSLYGYYMNGKNYAGAVKTAKELVLEHPYQWRFPATVGQLYTGLKDYGQSLWYLKRSFNDSNTTDIARKIVFDQLQMDSLQDALPYLQYIREHQPDDLMSVKLTEKAREILALKKLVRDDPRNLNAIRRLGGYYLYLGNITTAKNYIDRAVDIAPRDSGTIAQVTALKKLESGELPEELKPSR
jgi:tetratricopeptide (TPR) repeat protein